MARVELAEDYERKALAYARFGNGLVADRALAFLPEGGRVLDVGCASGGLLEILRERASYTAGIEPSETAAREAAKHADKVVAAPVEDENLPFEEGTFDVVVLADVLEHLVDPAAALKRSVALLAPGGHAVISVPNIVHWRARLTLLRGEWRTETTGTFDSGHLRQFDVRSAKALVRQAGLIDIDLDPVVPALSNHVRGLDRLPGASGERLSRAWQRIGRRWPGLFGYQLVVSGLRAN